MAKTGPRNQIALKSTESDHRYYTSKNRRNQQAAWRSRSTIPPCASTSSTARSGKAVRPAGARPGPGPSARRHGG